MSEAPSCGGSAAGGVVSRRADSCGEPLATREDSSAAAMAFWTSSWALESDASGVVDGSIVGMSTRLRGPSTLCGIPATSWTADPRPSRALVISEGTTQTLLAEPSAIFGIIWRYW